MDATTPALSVGQLLPWALTFLKYADDVVNSIPGDGESLDWRPDDGRGGWYFSIREQAMHIADTRHDALSWITGEDVAARTFCTEYGGTEKPWQFRQASRAEILESMKAGRAAALLCPARRFRVTAGSRCSRIPRGL